MPCFLKNKNKTAHSYAPRAVAPHTVARAPSMLDGGMDLHGDSYTALPLSSNGANITPQTGPRHASATPVPPLECGDLTATYVEDVVGDIPVSATASSANEFRVHHHRSISHEQNYTAAAANGLGAPQRRPINTGIVSKSGGSDDEYDDYDFGAPGAAVGGLGIDVRLAHSPRLGLSKDTASPLLSVRTAGPMAVGNAAAAAPLGAHVMHDELTDDDDDHDEDDHHDDDEGLHSMHRPEGFRAQRGGSLVRETTVLGPVGGEDSRRLGGNSNKSGAAAGQVPRVRRQMVHTLR